MVFYCDFCLNAFCDDDHDKTKNNGDIRLYELKLEKQKTKN